MNNNNLQIGWSRLQIMDIIGREYLTRNLETDEYSYKQVLGKGFDGHYKLDIRFYDNQKKWLF